MVRRLLSWQATAVSMLKTGNTTSRMAQHAAAVGNNMAWGCTVMIIMQHLLAGGPGTPGRYLNYRSWSCMVIRIMMAASNMVNS